MVRYGFLSETERRLIDEYSDGPGAIIGPFFAEPPTWIEKGPQSDETDSPSLTPRQISNAKYRLRNGGHDIAGIQKQINTFCDDIIRIRNYHCQVRQQPGGQYEWEDFVVPLLKTDIKYLRDTLNDLLELADRDVDAFITADLSASLDPLVADLSALREHTDGNLSAVDYSATEDKEMGFPDDVKSDLEELAVRRDALTTLLGDRQLFEPFEYIQKTPPKKQKRERKMSENTIGKRTWRVVVGQALKSRYGLVKEEGWGLQLTTRGHIVYKAYRWLEFNEFVGSYAGEADNAAIALHLLSHHSPNGLWQLPDGVSSFE